MQTQRLGFSTGKLGTLRIVLSRAGSDPSNDLYKYLKYGLFVIFWSPYNLKALLNVVNDDCFVCLKNVL